MWERIIHRWLSVPYTLNVYTQKKNKKPKATILFLHGIGNSGAAWDAVITKLPDTIRIISIDLLGFGRSPRPDNVEYNATTQARAVIATVLRAGIRGRLIIVGHSLGALVAVEVARRYPMMVRSLVLCSPPFYKSETHDAVARKERQLRSLYRLIKKHPDQFVKIISLAAKYKIVNKSFSLTDNDVASYMETLEASIINQSALYDAVHLRQPMTIIHGRFDNYVIRANMKYLCDRNTQAQLKVIAAGHEVRGLYVAEVVKSITNLIPASNKKAAK